jgi:hypothetical protein
LCHKKSGNPNWNNNNKSNISPPICEHYFSVC